MLSGTGAFSNPHEYREIMCAAVGYSDKTVEEVIAEHERRQKEREAASKSKAAGTTRTPPRAGVAQPKQAEMDKLAQLLSFARKSEDPVAPGDPK